MAAPAIGTAVLALLLLAWAVPDAVAQELLQPREIAGIGAGSSPPPEPTTDLRVWVDVEPAVLEAGSERIAVTLPEGVTLHASRTSFERRAPGRVTWRGSVGEGQGSLTLTLHDGFVVGRIHHGDRVYSLAPVHGVHRLARLLPNAFPSCGGARGDLEGRFSPAPSHQVGAIGDGDPADSADSAVSQPLVPKAGAMTVPTIDVMILYTPLARLWAAGVGQGSAAIEALAQASVDVLNTAWENSRVNARARLVGAFERALVQGMSEEMSPLLEKMTFDAEVMRLRDQTRADLVSLLINATEDGSELCGLAWGMAEGRVNSQFHHFGFNVMRVQCAVDNLTFPHEIGHNLGAFHYPGSPPPEAASFPWSFGHLVQGSFRTIMMPSSQCEGSSVLCPRLPHFSNPAVSQRGHPTGIRNQRDNHRTFNQTAPLAATFRLGNADPPLAPTDLEARAFSGTRVELSWRDRASRESSYRVERAEDNGPFVQVVSLPANSTAATVEDLMPETRYRFRVRAHNAAGPSPFSNVAEATTLLDLPPAPSDLAIEVESETAVRLTWASVPNAAVHLEMASPEAGFTEREVLLGGALETRVEGLSPATPYTFRLRASNTSGFSPYGDEASTTTRGRQGACVPDAENLCLLDGRFEVRVRWRNPRQEDDSGAGQAVAVPGSDVTGTFWFFNRQNIELIVKMLDGTSLNGFFWHFYGALSDVEYWVSVRDTETEESRTFHNPPFEICGQADTQAFSREPAAPDARQSLVSTPSTPSTSSMSSTRLQPPQLRTQVAEGTDPPAPLTFQDGRFEVEVTWRDPRSGDTGVGRPVESLSTGETGFLWFFQPDNLELVVKILDGRAINGQFWFFWGGLSDVEYTIRVRDTETGDETTYTNEAFQLCGGADLDTL